MSNILNNTKEEPDLSKLSLSDLKQLASNNGIENNYCRLQYIVKLKKIWLLNKKENTDKNTDKNTDYDNQCTICINDIEEIDKCVTSCNHKFCLSYYI
jgi:hypothetical protein